MSDFPANDRSGMETEIAALRAKVARMDGALRDINILLNGERANLVIGAELPAPWGGSQRWGYSLGEVDTKSIKLWLERRRAALAELRKKEQPNDCITVARLREAALRECEAMRLKTLEECDDIVMGIGAQLDDCSVSYVIEKIRAYIASLRKKDESNGA